MIKNYLKITVRSLVRNWSNLILVFILFNTLTACQSDKNIPGEFKKYITHSSTQIEYKKIAPFYGNNKMPMPDLLTRKEALEDIDIFEYLFTTSYSGYDYWRSHGVDFKSFFSGLKNFANQKDTISIGEFEEKCAKILNMIHDGHISFIGKTRHFAYKHKSIYYCDIVVEETNDGKFKVINSLFNLVKPGDMFTQKKHKKYLYKTLSATRKNDYLIGLLSFSPITSQQLSFNNKTIKVPFYESRLNLARFNDNSPFYIERENNIPIIRVSSFANEIYPLMKKFMDSGNKLKNEKQIIVNEMNNIGGASLFPQTFIYNLNGTSNWDSYWAKLESPSIVQYYAGYDLNSATAASPNFRDLILSSRKELPEYINYPTRTWEFSSTSNGNLQGTYKGRMIVSVNRNVVSGGEAFVGFSQSIKNRIVVGENTGGVGMFSSACGYYLPNSKFILYLPQHFILIPGFEECIGFFPDYWLNTTKPVKEIMKWLNDSCNYQFAYSKSYNKISREQIDSLLLPEDLHIVAPGPNMPKDVARFSGKWFGVADGVLDHLLVVEKIHSNTDIDAIYAWGTASLWNIYKPGWERFKGKIKNQNLILTNGMVTIIYKFRSDGKLDGTYERPGVFSSIILKKVE